MYIKGSTSQIGFTLIEILLVVALICILGATAYPIGMSFFTAQLLDDTTNEFVSVMREAQHRAIAQKNDSDYGIKILPDSFTLFTGSSHESRIENQDEVFSLPRFVTITGVDELVFKKQTGIPSTAASFTLVTHTTTSTVSINAHGTIEK